MGSDVVVVGLPRVFFYRFFGFEFYCCGVVFCGWWSGFQWWGWVLNKGGFAVEAVVGSNVVVSLL